MKNEIIGGKLSLGLLILIFVLLAIGILVVGHLFYSHYVNSQRTQVERELSAIADLKAGDLVQWRKERIGDANQLFGNTAFSSLVQRYFDHPDDMVAQDQLKSWLAAFQANYQYASVFLLDTQGAGRVFIPDTGEPVPRHIPQDAQMVLQSGKVTILDLERDEDTPQPHMVVLIPIFRQNDINLPLGVVVMRIDPYQYLYPLISRWPTPSKTAETLLVRRDGNEVLFLNDLKFQEDTALKLHSTLENTQMAAVQAVMGKEGIIEALDYRGVETIADVRHIPDSPWFMVARIDTSEVYAPLTQMLWVVIALVGALLIGTGAGVGLVWRRQSVLVYKERAETAEALSQSETRYRDLFENASLAISISTLERKLRYVNPKFASMFGYGSPEEVMASVKDTAADLFADPHQREEIVRLKQANPDLNKFEILYRRKDGSAFSGSLTVRMLTHSDGSSVFESFIEDITSRKQAEEALRESEELFRVAQEISPDGFTILHPLRNEKGEIIDFTWVYENKTIARINGTDPEEVKGKRMLDLFPTHKGTSVFEAYVNASNSGEPQIIGEVYVGEIVSRPTWLRMVIVSIGEDIAILAQDITDRKQSENDLRESEFNLRGSQKIAHIGHWILNLRTNKYTWSEEAFRIIGVEPGEFKGDLSQAWRHAVHPEDLDRLVAANSMLKSNQRLTNVEYRVVRPDGSIRHVIAIAGDNITDNDGNIIQLTGVIQDITERKLAEEKLEKSYESLKKTLNDAINTMVKIVELRDPYTAGHQQKVAELSIAIAGEMKLDDTRLNQLHTAALIHDIGKMYVPSDILSKPGKLADIELGLIKTHSRSGYDIVKSMDFPGIVAVAVLQHHERLDGSGYPDQLKGEETLLEAKILAVADVVEAMSSHRPYRPALGIDKALEEISKNRGKLYDPDVVNTCVDLFKSGRFQFK